MFGILRGGSVYTKYKIFKNFKPLSGHTMAILFTFNMVLTWASYFTSMLFYSQITSLICLLCLCTSGTFRLNLFLLPLLGRIRFMMFVTIFSLLITCIFLFLDVTHIIFLFPFNWGRIVSINFTSIFS